jgi:hypothetical protein
MLRFHNVYLVGGDFAFEMVCDIESMNLSKIPY